MPSKLTNTLCLVFVSVYLTACTGTPLNDDDTSSTDALSASSLATPSSATTQSSVVSSNRSSSVGSSSSSDDLFFDVPPIFGGSGLSSSSSSSSAPSTPEQTPEPIDFTGKILPAKQCDSTASCRETFGEQATDCTNSKSETSRCLCGQDTCGEVFNAQSLVYAINAGAKAFTDSKGLTYVADFGAVGTTNISTRKGQVYSNTNDHELYQTQRYANNLTYELPVSEGVYNVTLKMVEGHFTGPGQRVFDIYAEGEVLASNLDLYADNGNLKVKDYSLKDVLVTDGSLTIRGVASVNNATVAAIIVTSASGIPTCNTNCMAAQSEKLFTVEEPQPSPQDPAPSQPTNEPSGDASQPSLYKNSFNAASDLVSLALRKGAQNTAIVNYNKKGRTGKGLQITHKKSSSWEATLGTAKLSKTVDVATLSYSVFVGDDWQYRLQGKLPGLAPVAPHFGGNKNDAPAWNKWSVRLMWISTRNNVTEGNDDLAVPSIYVYDQNRIKGKTGTHYRVNSFKMPKNEWLDIVLTVKLNTYNNKTARSDGSVELKINGEVIETITGLKLRGNVATIADKTKTKIHNVAFHNYYGGSKEGLDVPTQSSTKIIFDDIRVTQ